MKTLITARLTSTEGERPTSAIKAQLVSWTNVERRRVESSGVLLDNMWARNVRRDDVKKWSDRTSL